MKIIKDFQCSKLFYNVYADGIEESFTPSSKVEEFGDCYEFEREMTGKGGQVVVIMKDQIRKISFSRE